MSERVFRLIVGVWLLVALYLGLPGAVYALIALLLFEGTTNLRVPMLVSRLRGMPVPSPGGCAVANGGRHGLSFEAERALRFMLAALLILTYVVYVKLFWVFPWFIGFALIGAGLSGICPIVLALRAVGLR